jgi:iron complex transport system substrate-binding protein
MKKSITLLLISIVSAIMITGCGKQEKAVEKTANPAVADTVEDAKSEEVNTQSVEETDENKTKVVHTDKGDVEIPVNATRIVIQSYVGDLLAFRVLPIGGDMDPKLFDDLLDNSEYKQIENFDPETVMALEPDLIIIQGKSESADYDKLSLIAPTIALNDLDMTTEERVLYLGELLGKEKEAQETIDSYINLAKENKQKLIAAGIENKTITVIEEPYIFGEKYGRGADVVYNFLGFTAPDKLQKEFDTGNFYAEVSMEVLHEYCGDYILRSIYEGAEDLSDNQVWNNIDAVKNGNVIEIDFNQFYARDIYVMSKQMNFITEALLATVNE